VARARRWAGVHALREVAGVLDENTRGTDAVAHFGGRESVGADQLFTRADRAMYVVKAGGGNGAVAGPHAVPESDREPA
jgi:GGDEF domain-containing protein